MQTRPIGFFESSAWALSVARRAGLLSPPTPSIGRPPFCRRPWSTPIYYSAMCRRRYSRPVRAWQRGFAIGNRLYPTKSLKQLGPARRLGICTARLQRDGGRLLNLVKGEIDPAAAGRHGKELVDAKAPALRSGVELRALYLLAIEEIQPTSKGAKLADWLLAADKAPAGGRTSERTGRRGSGPLVPAGETAQREIHAHGLRQRRSVETLRSIRRPTQRRLEVPADMLVQGHRSGSTSTWKAAAGSATAPFFRGLCRPHAWRGRPMTGSCSGVRAAQRMLDGERAARFRVVSGSYTFFRKS